MQYLRLERKFDTNHVSCTALEAYDGTQWMSAISGKMSSIRGMADPAYSWPKVQDRDNNTMAFTSNAAPGEFIELDFGPARINATSVHMMHGEGLGGGWERSIGVTLYVLDGQRNIIFEHTWMSMPLTRSETFLL
jgi:hypothetical protein